MDISTQTLEQKETHYENWEVNWEVEQTQAELGGSVGSGAGGWIRHPQVGSGAVTQPPALLTREGPQMLPCLPLCLLAAFKWTPVV